MEPFIWFVPYIALGCAVVTLWVGNTERKREEHWDAVAAMGVRDMIYMFHSDMYANVQLARNEAEDARLSKWISYAFALVFAGIALFVQP